MGPGGRPSGHHEPEDSERHKKPEYVIGQLHVTRQYGDADGQT